MTTWSASRSTLVEGGEGRHGREPGRQRAGRRARARRARACRTPPPARPPRSRGRRRRPRRASVRRARTASRAGGGRHRRSSCARTSAGSCRANASISPSTCSAMLIAWLPLPLVSTRCVARDQLRRRDPVDAGAALVQPLQAGAASRMASIGGPVQAIAAASARSRPLRQGVAVELQELDARQGVAERPAAALPRSDGERRRSRGASVRAAPGLRPRAASRS